MISRAIKSLYPNAEFALEDNNYETVRWFANQPNPLPTIEELQAEVDRLKQQDIDTEYQSLRRREYPSIGDQLDALWKGGAVAEEMLAKVQAIKAKYPKPEGL